MFVCFWVSKMWRCKTVRTELGSKAVVGLDADGDVYMAKFDTIPV